MDVDGLSHGLSNGSSASPSAFQERLRLEQAASADPWSQEPQLALMDFLEEHGMSQELEVQRASFATKFIPSVDFWRAWLTDKINDGDLKATIALFTTTFGACPHLDLVTDFLAYVERCVDDGLAEVKEFRSALEPALCTAGADIASGALVWEPYRRLEVEEYEEQVDNATPEAAGAVRDAKAYVIGNVYTRQLSIPLLGNEKVLAELEGFLSEHCDASEVDIIKPEELQQKYTTALGLRKPRVPFEEKVLMNADSKAGASSTDRVQRWMDYIQFEIKEKCYGRAERLYERAIMDCPSSHALLFDSYLSFTAEQTKNWGLLEDISKRALIVSYNNIKFWHYRFLAVELANSEDVKEKVDACFLQAQSAGFASPMDYLSILNIYCDFYRRRLTAAVSQEAATLGDLGRGVDQMRAAFDVAEAFLTQYYPTWFDGYYSIAKYRISVEDSIVADVNESLSASPAASNSNAFVPNSRDVWERVISKFGKDVGASIWIDYTKWAFQATRDVNICKKLLRRALAALKDPVSSSLLHAEMLRLEQQHGAGAAYVLSSYIKYGFPAAQLTFTSHANYSSTTTSASDSSALDHAPAVPIVEASNSVAVAQPTKSTAKRDREENLPQNVTESTVPTKKPKVSDVEEKKEPTIMLGNVDVVGADNHSPSLFVKNVSFSISEDEFLAPFRAIGEVTSCVMLKSENGKLNGMAIVTFSSPDSAATALKTLTGHSYGNRKITVDFYHPPANSAAEPKDGASNEHHEDGGKFHPTTLFVSKLPARAGESDVATYFGSFGAIRLARLLLDKNTGESKCRALVEFQSEDALQRAMAFKGHTILNETVFVTRSKFPAAVPEKKAVDSHGSGSASKGAAISASNGAATNNNSKTDGSADRFISEPTTGKKLVALGLKPRVLRK